MTTARERYELRTKVVTFRVRQEVFNQLKKLRLKASFLTAI